MLVLDRVVSALTGASGPPAHVHVHARPGVSVDAADHKLPWKQTNAPQDAEEPTFKERRAM